MPTITISMDGVEIKEIDLTKERTTLGRRPYNDIVVDHLAVSGEHAVLLWRNNTLEVEDMASTNGTFVNGKSVLSAPVTPEDVIEVGKCKIRLKPGPLPTATPAPQVAVANVKAQHAARIRVINGAAAGREMDLVKIVTTLGKPGVAVASITQRPQGYMLAKVEGPSALNGKDLDTDPVTLHDQDVITLAGTQMRFEILP